jgi:DNA-binding transcriptional LysR family regulator
MDLLNECGFTKSKIRQNVKIVPKLLVQGADALREAALAGCGIIRCLACHVEDELAAHKLVPVLTDLELYQPSKTVTLECLLLAGWRRDSLVPEHFDSGGRIERGDWRSARF